MLPGQQDAGVGGLRGELFRIWLPERWAGGRGLTWRLREPSPPPAAGLQGIPTFGGGGPEPDHLALVGASSEGQQGAPLAVSLPGSKSSPQGARNVSATTREAAKKSHKPTQGPSRGGRCGRAAELVQWDVPGTACILGAVAGAESAWRVRPGTLWPGLLHVPLGNDQRQLTPHLWPLASGLRPPCGCLCPAWRLERSLASSLGKPLGAWLFLKTSWAWSLPHFLLYPGGAGGFWRVGGRGGLHKAGSTLVSPH